jgi:hypothetical protein
VANRKADSAAAANDIFPQTPAKKREAASAVVANDPQIRSQSPVANRKVASAVVANDTSPQPPMENSVTGAAVVANDPQIRSQSPVANRKAASAAAANDIFSQTPAKKRKVTSAAATNGHQKQNIRLCANAECINILDEQIVCRGYSLWYCSKRCRTRVHSLDRRGALDEKKQTFHKQVDKMLRDPNISYTEFKERHGEYVEQISKFPKNSRRRW